MSWARTHRAAVAMVAAVGLLAAACGDGSSTTTGQAESGASQSGSAESSSSTTTSTTEPTTSTSASSTTSSSSTTTSTTEPTTITVTSPTTATTVAAPQGLPSPEDVAHQYDTLCLQSNSRDLAEKWFEPGVLDELGCQEGGEVGFNAVSFTDCLELEDPAGEASHSCFFYYEGGGYSILMGDLGRGYRGLAVLFVID